MAVEEIPAIAFQSSNLVGLQSSLEELTGIQNCVSTQEVQGAIE